MKVENPENTAINEVLSSLGLRQRAILILKALEDFDEGVIAYCLDMPTIFVYYLSWRLRFSVRKVLEQNKRYPWQTYEAFYESFVRVLEEEVRVN